MRTHSPFTALSLLARRPPADARPREAVGRLAALLCLSPALAACPNDADDPLAASTGTTDTGTTTVDEPTTGEPTTGEPPPPLLARGGVTITRVEASSGVAVPIGLAGAAVGGGERNAVLPGRRDTTIRAFVDVPDDWTARELVAELRLVGGGVDETHAQTLTIAGDSTDAAQASTFRFVVPAEQFRPGLKYSITLWEAGAGAQDLPAGVVPPRAPHTGEALVGVEAAETNMRVVLVPIDYEFGDCKAVVVPSAWLPKLERALYQQNPTATLELTAHAPFEVTYEMTVIAGIDRLVEDISALRSADRVGPEVYYFGLFDLCGECVEGGGGKEGGCIGGVSMAAAGPTKEDAWARAAVGHTLKDTEVIFVHELGHLQGRLHVACPDAKPGMVDPSYPHEHGLIGAWGLGILDLMLRDPAEHSDHMSYCLPNWVSDWTWNALYQRNVTVTAWQDEGPPAGDGLLIGAIDGDRQRWWTAPGSFTADAPISATHSVDYVIAGETTVAPARVSPRPHSGALNLVAPLPPGLEPADLQRLVVHTPAGATMVAPDSVRWLHRPGALTSGR